MPAGWRHEGLYAYAQSACSPMECYMNGGDLLRHLAPGHAVLTEVPLSSPRTGLAEAASGQRGLDVRHVAHAVGPDWSRYNGGDGLRAIREGYDTAADLLRSAGARRVAASLLGVGREPRADLAKICDVAVTTLAGILRDAVGDGGLQEIHLVAYSPAEQEALGAAIAFAGGEPVTPRPTAEAPGALRPRPTPAPPFAPPAGASPSAAGAPLPAAGAPLPATGAPPPADRPLADGAPPSPAGAPLTAAAGASPPARAPPSAGGTRPRRPLASHPRQPEPHPRRLEPHPRRLEPRRLRLEPRTRRPEPHPRPPGAHAPRGPRTPSVRRTPLPTPRRPPGWGPDPRRKQRPGPGHSLAGGCFGSSPTARHTNTEDEQSREGSGTRAPSPTSRPPTLQTPGTRDGAWR